MGLVEFGTELEDHIRGLLEDEVGTGSDPDDFVRTFDDHLRDVDIAFTPNPWPFVVVTTRGMELSGRSEPEIGTTHAHNLHQWEVHIYYIDVAQNYAAGKAKRTKLAGKITSLIERNPTLSNFESSDSTGREYVWDTTVSNVVLDASGEEETYTFVTEIYLTIDTAKS